MIEKRTGKKTGDGEGFVGEVRNFEEEIAVLTTEITEGTEEYKSEFLFCISPKDCLYPDNSFLKNQN